MLNAYLRFMNAYLLRIKYLSMYWIYFCHNLLNALFLNGKLKRKNKNFNSFCSPYLCADMKAMVRIPLHTLDKAIFQLSQSSVP